MLTLPNKGINRSIERNNVDGIVFGNWIEGSLLFDDNELSKSDLVDILCEQQICEQNGQTASAQDMANQIVDDGWSELRKRQVQADINDGLIIESNSIRDIADWRDDPVRAFLVMLSLLPQYPEWAEINRDTYSQGNLFEKVVLGTCKNLFDGWKHYHTGWSGKKPDGLRKIVTNVASFLNSECASDLDDWISTHGKDGGLDIVFYRPFSDNSQAFPVYFIQCASGNNWQSKVDTPNVDSWQTYAGLSVRPSKGIATPFIIDEKILRMASLRGQCIVLDRARLLSLYYTNRSVIPESLEDELVRWIEPKLSSSESLYD